MTRTRAGALPQADAAGAEAPRADESLAADAGLLSPDGKLHPCALGCHDRLMLDLGLAYDRSGFPCSRDGRRWLHVSVGRWWTPPPPAKITQAQLDAIFDWTRAVPGRELPAWVGSAEIA